MNCSPIQTKPIQLQKVTEFTKVKIQVSKFFCAFCAFLWQSILIAFLGILAPWRHGVKNQGTSMPTPAPQSKFPNHLPPTPTT
jgi:hypothetical protein